jgi:cytochrome bd-type quinol oxidase subunit 2
MKKVTHQVAYVETENSARQGASRLGFWTSILTAGAAAAALGIAITTAPARSGPFCMVESCITYPYTDAAAFVPNDYLWMYPAFLMGPLFVILVVCLHHYASVDKKVFSQIALSLAVISATALATNYFIQLTVVQPSLLKGEVEGLSLFSQYNPHGVFIALEDVGYLTMGVAFLFAATVFGRRERLERVIRALFIASGVLAVGSLFLLALLYGSDLEYRYEVVVLLIDWITLIVSGALLSVFFKRAGR